jgi:hypothetical protein
MLGRFSAVELNQSLFQFSLLNDDSFSQNATELLME